MPDSVTARSTLVHGPYGRSRLGTRFDIPCGNGIPCAQVPSECRPPLWDVGASWAALSPVRDPDQRLHVRFRSSYVAWRTKSRMPLNTSTCGHHHAQDAAPARADRRPAGRAGRSGAPAERTRGRPDDGPFRRSGRGHGRLHRTQRLVDLAGVLAAALGDVRLSAATAAERAGRDPYE